MLFAHHLSRRHELKKVFELKTRQVYFIYLFLRRLKLENLYKDFLFTTSRLVRTYLLISAITKSFELFAGKLVYKSNRKHFSCIYIAYYKHSGVGGILDSYTNPRLCLASVTNTPNSSLAIQTRETFSISIHHLHMYRNAPYFTPLAPHCNPAQFCITYINTNWKDHGIKGLLCLSNKRGCNNLCRFVAFLF